MCPVNDDPRKRFPKPVNRPNEFQTATAHFQQLKSLNIRQRHFVHKANEINVPLIATLKILRTLEEGPLMHTT